MTRNLSHPKSIPRRDQDVLLTLKSQRMHFPAKAFLPLFSFLLQCPRGAQREGPGILALVGPPGSGKTCALEHAGRLTGVTLVRFSLADCESTGAGSPAAAVRRLAQHVQSLEDAGTSALTVLEDCECGIASPKSGEGSSTNRPQLQGVIQELLDGTHVVDGRPLSPKRMVFTSNNLSDLRSSLVREGRALVVEYKPDREDRSKIAACSLQAILPPRVLHPELRRLSKLTVAEIVAVREELRKHAEQLLLFDLPWTAYNAWAICEHGPALTDAVAKRVLDRGDVRRAVKTIRNRARLRRASFL